MSITGTESEPVEKLLEDLHAGRIQIPEFQRELDLQPDWVIGLLASVSLNYPIGAVTLLRTEGRELPFTSRPVPGAPAASGRPELLLIDGQSRLTALYQAFRQGGERSYHLDVEAALDPGIDRDRAIVAVPDGEQAHGRLFPLRRVFGPRSQRRDFAADRLETEVLQAFREYVLPVIALGEETARWTVRVHGGPDGPSLSEGYFIGCGKITGPSAPPDVPGPVVRGSPPRARCPRCPASG